MSKLLLVLMVLCQESAEKPRRAYVDMAADGTIAIGREAVAWKDLAASLKAKANAGIRELILRADGAVPFSSVQSMMAAAKEAGIEGVQFASDKPMPPVKFADASRRSVRIKLREGAKGMEIVLLQEHVVASVDDLKKQLKAMEKGPVVIDADFEVPYGAVREIISALTDQGFEKVSFAGPAQKADPIRVLLAFHQPTYEYRYLRNWLERSKEFKTDLVLTSGDARPGMLVSFPTDLSTYAVVVMGGAELDAAQTEALRAFVERGGGVVWSAADTVDAICPVRMKADKEMSLARTKAQDHPLLSGYKWSDLQVSVPTVEKVDDGAEVLAESDRGAFLVIQTVGKGRAAFVATDETYRWRHLRGDEPHFGPFWARILKWAANR